MTCDSCKSDRVLWVSGTSSDCNSWIYKNGVEKTGYLPHVPHVCGGDYYELSVCLSCGKVQGKFPVECEELNVDSNQKALQCFLDNYGNSEGKLYSLGVLNPVELLDTSGRTPFSHHAMWDAYVHVFLIVPTQAERDKTYVLIDQNWDYNMCKLSHYEMPSSEYEMTEISAGSSVG